MKTIAVVEDNKHIANQIKSHIEKDFGQQFRVIIAKTYQSAMDLIEGGLVNIYIIDICLPDGSYVHLLSGTRAVLVEFYDLEKNEYQTIEMKNMSLEKFMREYNESGIFLRCHREYIVNKKMVKKINIILSDITLLYEGKNGRVLHIPIGMAYKKDVLSQLRGIN